MAVVNTVDNCLSNTIPVGNNPVAIGETPNALKLYVANQGDNTVNAFNVMDRSLRSVIAALSILLSGCPSAKTASGFMF